MRIVNQKETPSVPPERPVLVPVAPPVKLPETPNVPPEIVPSPEKPSTRPLRSDKNLS